jgi:hypothetical protein
MDTPKQGLLAKHPARTPGVFDWRLTAGGRVPYSFAGPPVFAPIFTEENWQAGRFGHSWKTQG